jgi:hypothetical protein
MAVSMMPVVVLIVCKTVMVGEPDQNSNFTGWQNREWAYEDSKLVCNRQEVAMFDSAEAQGADPQTFNINRCMAAAIRLGAQWDVDHPNSNYRTWRVACPTPIAEDKDADGAPDLDDHGNPIIVGWKLPECGHQDIVTCNDGSEI